MSDYWGEENKTKVYISGNQSGNVSSGLTATASCCGCVIPVTLIICGALLMSEPNNLSYRQGTTIAFSIIGGITLLFTFCQMCCISLFQCFLCFKCFRDLAVDESETISSRVVKDVGDNCVQLLQWCISFCNLIGPVVMIACAISLSAHDSNGHSIGIVSIVFGCYVILSFIFGCCTLCCAQCLNFCCYGAVQVADIHS
jgi:hypothetical protein